MLTEDGHNLIKVVALQAQVLLKPCEPGIADVVALVADNIRSQHSACPRKPKEVTHVNEAEQVQQSDYRTDCPVYFSAKTGFRSGVKVDKGPSVLVCGGMTFSEHRLRHHLRVLQLQAYLHFASHS